MNVFLIPGGSFMLQMAANNAWDNDGHFPWIPAAGLFI